MILQFKKWLRTHLIILELDLLLLMNTVISADIEINYPTSPNTRKCFCKQKYGSDVENELETRHFGRPVELKSMSSREQMQHARGAWGTQFKPREAKNMSYNEKVFQWLSNLPWIQVSEDLWVPECFPGTNDTDDCSDQILSPSDNQCKFERQAHIITSTFVNCYINNGELPARPMTFGYADGRHEEEIEWHSEQDRSF